MNNIIVEIFYDLVFLIISIFLFRIIQKRQRLNFVNILALSNLSVFPILSLISVANGRYINSFSFVEISRYYLSILLTAIGIFTFNLFVPNSIKNTNEISFILNKYIEIPIKKKFLFFISLFLISWFIKVANGLTAYGSASADKLIAMPYYITVIKQLSELLLSGITFIEISLIIINKHYQKWLFHFPIIVLTLPVVITSRAWFLWLFVVVFFMLYWTSKKLNYKKLIKYIPVVLLIFFFLFPLIIGYRTTMIEIRDEDQYVEGYDLILETFNRLTTKDYNDFELKNKENLSSRASFMEENIQLMNYASEDPMMGQLFLTSIMFVTPRFLVPNKFDYWGSFSSEIIIGRYYGINLRDISDNIPLYGYVDLLLPGCLIAGFIIALIIFTCFKISILWSKRNPIISISLITTILVSSFRVESHYIYFFSLFRNIIIIYIILIFINIINNYILHKSN